MMVDNAKIVYLLVLVGGLSDYDIHGNVLGQTAQGRCFTGRNTGRYRPAGELIKIR
jgi:hypothetical protein